MPRTILRLLLAVLGVIVIVRIGLTSAVLGPEWLPGVTGSTPTLDSEFRFLAVLATAAGVLLIWVSRAPERHAVLLHVLLAATMTGGLARLYSGVVVGWPARPAVIAMAIEMLAPPLAWALYAAMRSGSR